MAGTRKRIYSNGDGVNRSDYDHIAYKVPLKQNIGGGSTSRFVRRQPRDVNNWALQLKMLKEPLSIWDSENNPKWCSRCGESRHRDQFSKDPTRYDGKDVWCKQCRAADEKRRYWLQKDSEEMWRQWNERHILRLACPQTENEQAA